MKVSRATKFKLVSPGCRLTSWPSRGPALLRMGVGACRNRKMLFTHVGVLNISVTLRTVHFTARFRPLVYLEKLDNSVGQGSGRAGSWSWPSWRSHSPLGSLHPFPLPSVHALGFSSPIFVMMALAIA